MPMLRAIGRSVRPAAVLTLLGAMSLSGQDVRASPQECPAEPRGGGAIYGVVRDANTGTVLPDAFVSVRRDPAVEPFALVLTDDRGAYRICRLPAETRVSLQAHLAGHSGITVTLTPTEGETVEQTLRLALDGGTDPPEESDVPGRLLGRLVDRSTGDPVDAASLSLVSTAWQALSDERGSFLMEEVAPGPHVVRIRHLAYGTVRWPVLVVPGRTVELRIELSPVPIALEPIVVTTVRDRRLEMKGFYDRLEWSRRTGLGHFFTREEIERRNPLRLSHLLTDVPGLRVDCTAGLRGCRIVMARSAHRCAGATVYLDGFRLRIFGSESIDDFVVPADVAGIEVYGGMSDLAGEFADPNAIRCGAVAIWTRSGGP